MSDAETVTQRALPPTENRPGAAVPAAPRWVSYGLVALGALTCLVALAARRHAPARVTAPASAAPTTPPAASPPAVAERPAVAPVPARRPRVEMVFALDTTGSMSGLIEGAKRKIWSLASYVAQGQPTPDLRIGLIAYRDVGDEYVTRRYDLDGDLDRVYARLRTFRAGGGGDTPEHVSRALDEAVRRMSWTEGQDTVKVIYVVGDAPPHTDYSDGYDYHRSARSAVQRGIQVHTIRCGGDSQTETVWRKIASLGGGEFMTVKQDGGMREERTAYDAELARLHDKLNESTVAYGEHRAAVKSVVAAAAEAPADVKAERGRFMAKNKRAVAGVGDLVDDVASGTVKLEALPKEALPAELQSLSTTEQRARIQATQQERDSLRRQIDELSRKRDAVLDARSKEAAKAGESDGFDKAAKRSLKRSVDDNPMAGLTL